jgi:DNA-directed RNA polymerase specialized sigma24 family protein
MRPSFDAVFAAEFGPLYRYLRRRVGADGADDLAAATFATAYTNSERFDPAAAWPSVRGCTPNAGYVAASPSPV